MTILVTRIAQSTALGDWRRIAAIGLALALAACGTTPPEPAAQQPGLSRHEAMPPESGQACLADLAARHVSFEATTPFEAGLCHIATPVRVRSLAIPLSAAALMDCALADRLDRFVREAVQPAAQRQFHVAVADLRHFGTYSCRSRSDNHSRLSEHGLGYAIDVAGFDLADGRRILIEHDWRDSGASGRFLHEIARAACGLFSVVLTPDYNADHHNHFHLDIGPDRLCGINRAH